MVVAEVMVQATLIVLDDDDQVEEKVVTDPLAVPGKQWPGFSGEPWQEAIAPLLAQLEAPASQNYTRVT